MFGCRTSSFLAPARNVLFCPLPLAAGRPQCHSFYTPERRSRATTAAPNFRSDLRIDSLNFGRPGLPWCATRTVREPYALLYMYSMHREPLSCVRSCWKRAPCSRNDCIACNACIVNIDFHFLPLFLRINPSAHLLPRARFLVLPSRSRKAAFTLAASLCTSIVEADYRFPIAPWSGPCSHRVFYFLTWLGLPYA
jgi:hypothetical protein